MRMSELAAETDDSGMLSYLEHEAKVMQEVYLEYLKTIPDAYNRSPDQQCEADRLDSVMRQVNRELNAYRGQMHWNRVK